MRERPIRKIAAESIPGKAGAIGMPSWDDGFTMIEVMMAMFVLTVGIVGLMGTFDGARKLTLVSEQRASAAHRAQWEIEKLEAQPYEELAMFSAPAHSTEVTNPDYYVNLNSPVKCTSEGAGCYVANTEKTSEEEILVWGEKECTSTLEAEKSKCGLVAASPAGRSCSLNPIGSCEWKDGTVSGNLYDFVTWHSDVVCEKIAKTCSTKSYKRLTVISTATQPAASALHPQIRVSTFISDPASVPEGSTINGEQNPLSESKTKCGTESCITGIQKGNPQTWYLHDSYASTETPVAPNASHSVHATIAATGECKAGKTSGCPVPDLMDSTHPTVTTLYDYSSNLDAEGFTLGASEHGGRVLRTEAECSGTPANSGGEMWATPKLASATKLTGYGGITLYTQPLNNSAATVKLCLAIYDYPEVLAETPKLVGKVAEYTPASWPTTPAGGTLTSLSFVFTFLTEAQLKEGATVTVEAKHHIGLRVWPATSSTAAISIAYDTTGSSVEEGGKLVEKPGYPSLLQLNTE